MHNKDAYLESYNCNQQLVNNRTLMALKERKHYQLKWIIDIFSSTWLYNIGSYSYIFQGASHKENLYYFSLPMCMFSILLSLKELCYCMTNLIYPDMSRVEEGREEEDCLYICTVYPINKA